MAWGAYCFFSVRAGSQWFQCVYCILIVCRFIMVQPYSTTSFLDQTNIGADETFIIHFQTWTKQDFPGNSEAKRNHCFGWLFANMGIIFQGKAMGFPPSLGSPWQVVRASTTGPRPMSPAFGSQCLGPCHGDPRSHGFIGWRCWWSWWMKDTLGPLGEHSEEAMALIFF